LTHGLFCGFLLFLVVVSLDDSTSAIDCPERLVSEMTCCVLGVTLNIAQSLSRYSINACKDHSIVVPKQ